MFPSRPRWPVETGSRLCFARFSRSPISFSSGHPPRSGSPSAGAPRASPTSSGARRRECSAPSREFAQSSRAVWLIGVAWGITTFIAWVMVILTGDFPLSLYNFGVGALRWSTRVEAYLLLLHDEYPPFSLN